MDRLNKRRQTPLKYKNKGPNLNLIFATLLTVEYSKDVYAVLKQGAQTHESNLVRKRCHALMMKMSEPGLGCERIAKATGNSRNFVSSVIHKYNKEGMDSVFTIKPKSGRPNRLAGCLKEVSDQLCEKVPRSAAEAASIIETVSGEKFGLTWTRVVMHRCGFRFIKLQPIPGKASPNEQKTWVCEIQKVIKEAENGERRLFFMDAVHFTLEAFTCNVWCREPLFLRSGAGRNRFNLIGAIDPFTLDLIHSHSMMYVDAEQIMDFLTKIRDASGDIPVSIVLDNARYQHCRAVLGRAEELGIKLVFLPPYSPNLNIIERLWKYTRRHVLAGKYFDTPAKFHDALKHFFEVDFCNHKDNLRSLLTLNFQSFENAHLLSA